jgi:hypothetical protein
MKYEMFNEISGDDNLLFILNTFCYGREVCVFTLVISSLSCHKNAAQYLPT